MKCYILIIFSIITLAVSGKSWKPVYQPFDSLTTLWEQSMEEVWNISQKRQWLNQMYTIAREHNARSVFMWRTMYWESWLLQKAGQADSAFTIAQKAIKLVDTIQYEYDYRRLLRICINQYAEKGDYLTCYKAYKEQLKYYEQKGDTFNAANTYVAIGIMLNGFRKAEKALICLHKAEHIYRSIGKTSHIIKNKLNIANSFYMAGRQSETEQILNRIITNPVTQQDTSFHLNVLASLCSYSRTLEQKEYYSREAFSLAQKYGKEYAIIRSSVNMATIFFERKESDSALYHYRKVWNYLQSHDDNEVRLLTLNGLANSFQQKKQWDSAYIYMSAAHTHQDSLLQVNSLSEIHRIESRTTIERYESSLKQQQEDARMQRIILTLILILIVVLASASCYTFWSQRKKALIKKRMQKLESRELSTRLENEKLQNKYYQLEIDSKNRELTSNTLMLIEKNKILEELTKRINNGGEIGEIGKRTVIELKSQIKAHTGHIDEWQFFQVHFEQVHPNFFNKLKNICSILTEGELRLCAYIRTGMENKQIAQMLSQQPDTIKKARHRLRKKLLLNPDDSLEDFLRKI